MRSSLLLYSISHREHTLSPCSHHFLQLLLPFVPFTTKLLELVVCFPCFHSSLPVHSPAPTVPPKPFLVRSPATSVLPNPMTLSLHRTWSLRSIWHSWPLLPFWNTLLSWFQYDVLLGFPSVSLASSSQAPRPGSPPSPGCYMLQYNRAWSWNSFWSLSEALNMISPSPRVLNTIWILPIFTSLSLNPDWSIQPAALCLHLAVWQTPQIISFQWSPWFFLSSNSPYLLFPLTPLELLCSSICSD